MSGLTVEWLVTQIMLCTVKSFCFTYHPYILVTGATVSADNKLSIVDGKQLQKSISFHINIIKLDSSIIPIKLFVAKEIKQRMSKLTNCKEAGHDRFRSVQQKRFRRFYGIIVAGIVIDMIDTMLGIY
uniref:Uncharacterized protein n=1 Tax=Glossina pallidipes TaxID=7398 RepID=A0A1A9ZVC1_GLOPL